MTNPNVPQYNDDDPLIRPPAEKEAGRSKRDLLYGKAAKTMHYNISANGDRCYGLFIPTDYIDAIESKYEASKSARIYERFIEDPLWTATAEKYEEPWNWSNAYHRMGYFTGIDMAQRILGSNDSDIYFSDASNKLFEQIDNTTATLDDFIDTIRTVGKEYVSQTLTSTINDPSNTSTRNVSEFIPVLETLSQGLFLDQESPEATDLKSGFGLAHIICTIAYENKNGA